MRLRINGRTHELDVDPDMPLLWALRETLGLTGTKYGCGLGQCGACTVHVDGQARRACLLLVGSLEGVEITTIEGLEETHPVIEAWVAEDVPQCGFCQPGQVMSATALLRANPRPNDADIHRAMRGNLCRCGTYPRIVRAIRRAAGQTIEDG